MNLFMSLIKNLFINPWVTEWVHLCILIGSDLVYLNGTSTSTERGDFNKLKYK